jgi:hypothetical protein
MIAHSRMDCSNSHSKESKSRHHLIDLKASVEIDYAGHDQFESDMVLLAML